MLKFFSVKNRSTTSQTHAIEAINANIIFRRIHHLFSLINSDSHKWNFNSLRSNSFGRRHHKWCKCAVFNLHNSFIVEAFLLFFIKFICFRKFLLCISSGAGIKHPYIEKCHLTSLPKPTSTYVQPYFISCRCWWSKGLACSKL